MACDANLDDLPQFDDVPDAVKQVVIDIATDIVLGPTECHTKNEALWKCACLNACVAIKMLAAHILSVDPDIGTGSVTVVSERVGDVSATYANTSSSAGSWGDSIYGRLYSSLAARFAKFMGGRKTLPLGIGGAFGC
jgi:hypothetical protein